MTHSAFHINRIIIVALFAFAALIPATSICQTNSTWIGVGGVGAWNNAANWDTVNFPDNSGADFYNAFLNGGGDFVTLTGLIDIDSLNNNSMLDIVNNSTLTIFSDAARAASGSLFNTGEINLNATTLGAAIKCRLGEVTLDGGGTINMSNDDGNRLFGQQGGHLINENNLIRGSGNVGFLNTLRFTNRADGMVIADQAVPLNVVLNQGDTVNEGLFEARDGATMNIGIGPLENATGTIQAQPDSTVFLTGSSTEIRGGLLRSFGTGQFIIDTARIDSSGSATTLDGTFNVLNNRTFTIVGDLINQQNINLNATTLGSGLRIDGEVNLTGGGFINLGNDDGNTIGGQNNGLLINIDNVIRGSGTIGIANTLGFENRHQVIADQSVGLSVISNSTITNEGLFRASGGATLELTAFSIMNSGGTIEALDNSSVNLASVTIDGGLLRTEGTGSFDLTTSNAILDGTNGIIVDGTVNIGNTRALTLRGDIDHRSNTINLDADTIPASLVISGTVTLTGGGTINAGNDADNRISGAPGITDILINEDNLIRGSGNFGFNSVAFENRGTFEANQTVGLTIDPTTGGFLNDVGGIVRVSGSGGLAINGGGFENRGLFEIQPGRTATSQGFVNFVNLGFVSIGEDGLFDVTDNYTQTAGETALQGTLDASDTNDFDGGRLTGNGTVIGSSDFSPLAVIAPGTSAGILKFEDVFSTAGTFDIELAGKLVDGSNPVNGEVNTGIIPELTEFDQVNVFDTATLADGTTFTLDRINGFNPDVGDFFDLLTADSIVLEGSLNIETDALALTFEANVLNLIDPTTETSRDVLRFTTLSTLGDVNGDGVVNLLDVAPFVDAITSGDFIPAADINQDGLVNLLDVAPFVDLLTG